VGRRLSDIYRVSLGANVQSVAADAGLPGGYFFPQNQNVLQNPGCTTSTTSVLGTSTCDSLNNAYGINAPSIAQINSNQPYKVRSLTLGAAADSRDDFFNPRHGVNASVSDEVSGHEFGSDFNYQLITLDAARFFPVGKNQTFALHGRAGLSTGAIPTNKLFIFSDQDLRGYSDPFYGTDQLLGQAEFRIPLTADRKFSIANNGTTTTDLSKFAFHGDVGVGLRFDVPQLGLHTLRLDFAKGSQGTHTSFGIGQSF